MGGKEVSGTVVSCVVLTLCLWKWFLTPFPTLFRLSTIPLPLNGGFRYKEEMDEQQNNCKSEPLNARYLRNWHRRNIQAGEIGNAYHRKYQIGKRDCP